MDDSSSSSDDDDDDSEEDETPDKQDREEVEALAEPEVIPEPSED